VIRLVAFLAAFLPLASVACSADPGPGLPFFRRAQNPAPQVASPKKSIASTPPKAEAPVVAGVTSEQPGGSEVDTAEVIRRGDRVVRAGRGPMDAEEALVSEATSPPADDSHKWFFSLIVDDSKESQALLYDLKHSEHLRAWINTEEPKNSWSHATVYVAKDMTQDWRWAKLKITRYPVLILQPPAKLRDEKDSKSWEWGDPSTVVWQWDGYPSTGANRAQIRSDAIRAVLTAYVTKLSQRRAAEQVSVNAGPRLRTVPPPTPGARQSATPGPGQDHGNPPFQMPVFPTVPGSNPVLQTDPTNPSPQVAASTGAFDLLSMFLGKSLTNPVPYLAILAALKVFELFARRTKNPLDDKIVAFARSIVDRDQNPIKIDPTSPNASQSVRTY
jgi:hypothetical protein